MRYDLLVTVFLSWCYCTFVCAREKPSAHHKEYLDRIRCTRRYSVGSCGGPIAPVWSYVPHLQNCTQRLGCKKATVSNRFPTRKRCMRHCQKLRDLYTMLQSSYNITQNVKSLRGGLDTVHRSEMDSEKEEPDDYTDQEEQPEQPMMGAPADFYGDLGTEPPEPYNGWGRNL